MLTGYYQKNKERLSKKDRERYKIFLKKKKKMVDMVVGEDEYRKKFSRV